MQNRERSHVLDPKIITNWMKPDVISQGPKLDFGRATTDLAIEAGLLRRGKLVDTVCCAISPRKWTEDFTGSHEILNGGLWVAVSGRRSGNIQIVTLGVNLTDGLRTIVDSANVIAVLGSGLVPHLSRIYDQLARGAPEIIDGVRVWTFGKSLVRKALDPQTQINTDTIYQYADQDGVLKYAIRQMYGPDSDQINRDEFPWSVKLDIPVYQSRNPPLLLTARFPNVDGTLQARFEPEGFSGRLVWFYKEAGLYKASHKRTAEEVLLLQSIGRIRLLYGSLPDTINLEQVSQNLSSGRPGLEGIWQPRIEPTI